MKDLVVTYDRLTGAWELEESYPIPAGVRRLGIDPWQSHSTWGRGLGSLLGALEQATMGFGQHLPAPVREEDLGRPACEETGPGGASEPAGSRD